MSHAAPLGGTVSSQDLEDNRRSLDAERRSEERAMLSLSAPALAIVVILMVSPIAWLLSLSFVEQDGSFGLHNYMLFFSEPAYVQMFVNTFVIAFVVTGLCLILGYPVAYLLSILPARWSGILMLAVLVPFWTSTLVRTFSWLVILQRNGLVNKALIGMGAIDRPLPLVHNTTGTIVGMVHVMVPFLILPLYASMKSIDHNLMRAAASVGATPRQAFFNVFFPLSMPGLIAGTIMVFVMCLGFYITPAVLGGGKVKLIAQRIEEAISLYPTWGPAAALAVVLLVTTASCLTISMLIVRRLSYGR